MCTPWPRFAVRLERKKMVFAGFGNSPSKMPPSLSFLTPRLEKAFPSQTRNGNWRVQTRSDAFGLPPSPTGKAEWLEAERCRTRRHWLAANFVQPRNLVATKRYLSYSHFQEKERVRKRIREKSWRSQTRVYPHSSHFHSVQQAAASRQSLYLIPFSMEELSNILVGEKKIGLS